MKTFNLRNALVFALAAAALGAHAQVSYVLAGASYSFSLTTNTYVASETTFSKPAFTSTNPNIISVTLSPVAQNGYPGSGIEVYRFNGNNNQTDFYDFVTGSLAKNGFYTEQNGSAGTTLTVSGSPLATPEPSALAALGLGAVAFVKRRKRA